MPNPNVESAKFDELEYWKEQLRHGIHSKATKEYILRQIREMAARAGERVPAYNTTDFYNWLMKGSEL